MTGSFKLIDSKGEILLKFENPILEEYEIIDVLQKWCETCKTSAKLTIICDLEM
jgi:hypothetical protein